MLEPLIFTRMYIKVNNKEVECQGSNLSELIIELNLPEKGIAIAVNKSIIPRNQWNEYVLEEGADILIIKAFCGG